MNDTFFRVWKGMILTYAKVISLRVICSFLGNSPASEL